MGQRCDCGARVAMEGVEYTRVLVRHIEGEYGCFSKNILTAPFLAAF